MNEARKPMLEPSQLYLAGTKGLAASFRGKDPIPAVYDLTRIPRLT
jgi:hypothetical protein